MYLSFLFDLISLLSCVFEFSNCHTFNRRWMQYWWTLVNRSSTSLLLSVRKYLRMGFRSPMRLHLPQKFRTISLTWASFQLCVSIVWESGEWHKHMYRPEFAVFTPSLLHVGTSTTGPIHCYVSSSRFVPFSLAAFYYVLLNCLFTVTSHFTWFPSYRLSPHHATNCVRQGVLLSVSHSYVASRRVLIFAGVV